MQSEYRVAVTIRRPRMEVAEAMFDLGRTPDWMQGVLGYQAESGTPPELGSEFAWRIGKRAEIFEIVEYEEARTLVMESDDRVLTFELEGVPEGSIAWITAWSDAGGLRGIMNVFAFARQRRAAIRSLRKLKQLVESGRYRAA